MLDAAWPRNWKSESSPVGVWPPVQVTFWITASSPEPVCCTCRFQTGVGTNESIENPLGRVSTTFVVVAPSFSVGTARLYSSELPRDRHRRADAGVGGRGRDRDERDGRGRGDGDAPRGWTRAT